MVTLDILLAKLNGAIDEWNAKVDKALDLEQITDLKAKELRVKPGIFTRDFVFGDAWPKMVMDVVGDMYTETDRKEVIALAESVGKPTEITRDMRVGCKRAPDRPQPTMHKIIQLAHLIARAEKQPPAPAPPE